MERGSNCKIVPTKSSSHKKSRGTTPYEVWTGEKPQVTPFWIFGCIMYEKTIGGSLKKLDDRSKPMVFIRYERGSKGYRAYDPTDRRIHLNKDVVLMKEKTGIGRLQVMKPR